MLHLYVCMYVCMYVCIIENMNKILMQYLIMSDDFLVADVQSTEQNKTLAYILNSL